MPIKQSVRGTKATAEQRSKISAPFGEEEIQATGRMLKQAAKGSSPDRLFVLAGFCEDFLKQAGMPDDLRRVVWSLEKPGQWSEAPEEWPTENSRGEKLGTIADAARSNLIGYDSKQGYAARILSILEDLKLARSEEKFDRVESLAFDAGVLVAEAGWKELADHGWSFLHGRENERYDKLGLVIRDILLANLDAAPKTVWKEIARRFDCRTEDTDFVLEVQQPAGPCKEWELEIMGGRIVEYQSFSRRVRRMRLKLIKNPAADASD